MRVITFLTAGAVVAPVIAGIVNIHDMTSPAKPLATKRGSTVQGDDDKNMCCTSHCSMCVKLTTCNADHPKCVSMIVSCHPQLPLF